MVNKVSFDADMVRKLAELLDQTNLSEIEYEIDNQRIRVVRHLHSPSQIVHMTSPSVSPDTSAPRSEVSSNLASKSEAEKENPLPPQGELLKSPMVGTVYLSGAPNTPPFVKEGDRVEIGQTLLIIEAMKVMNPIRAPKAGTIKKVFVKDANPIEFDEVLMLID